MNVFGYLAEIRMTEESGNPPALLLDAPSRPNTKLGFLLFLFIFALVSPSSLITRTTLLYLSPARPEFTVGSPFCQLTAFYSVYPHTSDLHGGVSVLFLYLQARAVIRDPLFP